VEAGRQPLMRGGAHHIDLTVRDLEVSHRFYRAFLCYLGFVIAKVSEEIVEFELPRTSAARLGDYELSIGLVPARANAEAHDRSNPGLHHLALRAQSRADVDDFHVHLQNIGAPILDAPAEYPQYSPGYYAVFFSDPDGIKLEYVFKPLVS
jgi:catechol 2,3-dioxygenase-like lactoylglutathione lyase family enzyme